MNCARFEKLIALYVEGDLPVGQAARVEEHLLGCPPCQGLAESLKVSQAALKRLPQESVDPAVFKNIRDGVLAQLAGQHPQQVSYGRWWSYALAGACLLLAAILVFRPRPALRPPQAQVPVAHRQPAAVTAPPVRSSLAKVAKVHSGRVRKPVRRPPRELLSEPLLVKLVTDDPNIVIYWIVDRKGDGS